MRQKKEKMGKSKKKIPSEFSLMFYLSNNYHKNMEYINFAGKVVQFNKAWKK
jgi:hypothetical protein